jgi:hypothetical protein
MPDDLKDKEILRYDDTPHENMFTPRADNLNRSTSFTASEMTARGEEVFKGLYGDNAEGVHNLLHEIYPDMSK